MEIIQLETDTYPEISFNDICACVDDKDEEIGISLNILTSVTKDKLWEIMKTIEKSWKLSGDDMPIRITIETIEKQPGLCPEFIEEIEKQVKTAKYKEDFSVKQLHQVVAD